MVPLKYPAFTFIKYQQLPRCHSPSNVDTSLEVERSEDVVSQLWLFFFFLPDQETIAERESSVDQSWPVHVLSETWTHYSEWNSMWNPRFVFIQPHICLSWPLCLLLPPRNWNIMCRTLAGELCSSWKMHSLSSFSNSSPLILLSYHIHVMSVCVLIM